MPTVKELRSKLRALCLCSTGRKAVLEQRLQTAKEKFTRRPLRCTHGRRIEVGDPSTMIERAEEALLDSVNKEELVAFQQTDPRGPLECDRIPLGRHREQTRVSRMLFRNRFISTYKWDILSNNTEKDKVTIRTGNHFVHGGDCKRDAELYEAPALRLDFVIYTKLYGLHPGVVRSSISYRPTIDLLNRHATTVADKNIELPTKFNDLFVNFIKALETSNFEEGYLANPKSDVTVAYWAFLQSCP
ncbi:hypothetical protein I7I51_01878 [Histoplasma capsulatum]|uniref:SAP domain-containing protein n=1 Tax=Ajellomyces capsulatus TaxID=5037 RepID=A0A8A1MJL8_AJECA|nr:predicted protein [Histoplasma mississippiense (nom. inval.)]EDN02182.1 predicted protein [Histoplasma mississippiense (nom. inval.)]QSS64804.1 hypothetical protein I7I51_01878 [Histoplasma capsulatum]